MIHLIFTIILVIAQFVVTRRFAFMPLIVASLHTSQLGVLPNFSTARLVILVGLARAAGTGKLKWSTQCNLDLLILAWGGIALFTSLFHEPTGSTTNPVISRIRLVLDVAGTYLYARAYLPRLENWILLSRSLAFLALPLAIGMVVSRQTGNNPYFALGGASGLLIRDGEFRAAGPFGTPILAGTIGALLIPLFFMVWSSYKKTALLGFFSSVLIIFSSGSSTPIGSAGLALFFLSLWKLRQHIKLVLVGFLIVIISMQLAKDRPIWYLLAIMDFVGGSTGWHRAYLIDMAIEYFDEWWLYGTTFTRHWMPYGLEATPEHCDLTNYYIHLGVMGGITLPLILVFIFISSLRTLIKVFLSYEFIFLTEAFHIWCLGSLLIVHMIICLTISYFDQTYVLLFVLFGLIANLSQAKENEQV